MERKIDRFLKYLDYKGISENKATVDCGLSKGLIGQAKSGKSDLGNKAVEKVLIFYQDLNKVWLLTGEGEMLTPDQSRDSKPELVAELKPQLSNVEILLREMLAEERARVDALQERINELIEENARLKTLIESERKGGVA